MSRILITGSADGHAANARPSVTSAGKPAAVTPSAASCPVSSLSRSGEMDRLETRELAYFPAVADELHFGRTATRLGIAQSALSKTVRQLERRLGVTLSERTSRAVALTEAGRVLAREARVVLEAVPAAALRTQRAGTRGPRQAVARRPDHRSGGRTSPG